MRHDQKVVNINLPPATTSTTPRSFRIFDELTVRDPRDAPMIAPANAVTMNRALNDGRVLPLDKYPASPAIEFTNTNPPEIAALVRIFAHCIT